METQTKFDTIQDVINAKKELKKHSGNEYHEEEAKFTETLHRYLNRFRGGRTKSIE